jgi:excisionase family DNA binding protein
MDAIQQPDLLTAADVADLLRLPQARVGRMAKSGAIPNLRLPDGSVRFERTELCKWITALRRGGVAHGT